MKIKDVALGATQVKAGPDDGLQDGQFSAYASVFGNKDSYGDVVMPGAFDADLARWKQSGTPIPLLFGHNMSDPDYNIGHVADAVEDSRGLLVTAQLDLENPKAAQVYRMLKGRRVNQMSFAYDVVSGGPEKLGEDDVYALHELKLYEVSVVTIGANQETEILAVKSTADALAAAAKAGRTLSAKNESALRDARDSIDSVLTALDGQDGKAAPAAEHAQEQASGNPEVKLSASDEEPSAAKSPVLDEEPKVSPSAQRRATAHTLINAHVWAEGA